jgi:hypothetical protein
VGQFTATTEQANTLFIFLTPNLDGDNLYINTLHNIKTNVKFNRYNLFAHTNITEGDQTFREQEQQSTTLNQDNCICQHPDTHRIFNPRKYNNLGYTTNTLIHTYNVIPKNFFVLVSLQTQKFYLHENLGIIYGLAFITFFLIIFVLFR